MESKPEQKTRRTKNQLNLMANVNIAQKYMFDVENNMYGQACIKWSRGFQQIKSEAWKKANTNQYVASLLLFLCACFLHLLRRLSSENSGMKLMQRIQMKTNSIKRLDGRWQPHSPKQRNLFDRLRCAIFKTLYTLGRLPLSCQPFARVA